MVMAGDVVEKLDRWLANSNEPIERLVVLRARNEIVARRGKREDHSMTSCPYCASALLPAWFIPRMMTDEWSFGLLMTTGVIMAISCIDSVNQAADGSIWLDVRMWGSDHLWVELHRKTMPLMAAPTKRLQASINAAHVIAAFELADT